MLRVPKAQISLDREVAALVKLLESLPAALDIDTRKAILEESAKPMVDAAKSLAPMSDEVHYMYKTGHKYLKGLKAPKGMGKVSAVFHPGNLKDSIQVMKHGRFKKSINVYIGPRYPRRFGATSRFKNAPYAHILEFGSRYQKAKPYMRPAFDMTKRIVFNLARSKFGKWVDEWERKNKQ